MKPVQTRLFLGKIGFLSPRKRVTMKRCQQHDNFATCTGSPDSYLGPPSTASLAAPGPSCSPSSAVEKNGLRLLRASVANLLRSTSAPGARPLLWGSARLSSLLHSPRPVLLVLRREDRTIGLAGQQSLLHQALCLLRGTTLPRLYYQGSGRGFVPRLANGQGAGQAVHDRAAPPRRSAQSQGHWHRRNLRRQRPQLPDRGQRSDPRQGHLVRWPGSLRGQHGPVLCLARSPKIQQNTARGHGYVESVPQLHTQAGPCSAGFDHLRQVSCAASFAGFLGPGSQERIQAAYRARPPLHQRPKVRLAVALAQPHWLAQKGTEAALQRQQALAHGLPSEGIVRTALELRATGMGPAFLRQVASLSKMATPQTLREVCRHDREALGRHRGLLPIRQQSRSGIRRGSQQQDPGAATPSLWSARRGVSSPEDPHLYPAQDLT